MKNNKKGHRTRKQIIAEKEAASKRLVDQANLLKDPLEALPDFHKYTTSDGTEIKLQCQRVGDLDNDKLQWIFSLMERNMVDYYKASSWGWNESSKRKELTEPTAWYLIATINDELVGFSHFRYDMDFGVEVLYCYELQLETKARRKGIGKFFMNTLEELAKKSSMKKVVLTTLKKNTNANIFYEKLGYKVDKTSPGDWEDMDYMILSK